MDITPLISSQNMVIQSYGKNGFKISGTQFDTPVLVLPTSTVPLSPSSFAQINESALNDIAQYQDEIDLLIIGCGEHAAPASQDLRDSLKKLDINVETMTTGAACRSFNVLLGDGRRIAALLYPC